MSHDEGDDSTLAKSALAQIKKTKYGEDYENPVFLGLVVNDKARRIKAWECEGGLAARPEAASGLRPAGTGKPASPKAEDDEEDEESGPRMRPR